MTAAAATEDWRPMTEAADEAAHLRRAESDARPRSKGDPPSWAELERKAALVSTEHGGPCKVTGPIYTGPVMTTAQASAGLDSLNRRRLAGVQVYCHDATMTDNRDRLLRAQLGAALWALGVK